MGYKGFSIGELVRLKRKKDELDTKASKEFWERNGHTVGIIMGFNTGSEKDIEVVGSPKPTEEHPDAQVIWEEGSGLCLHWSLDDLEKLEFDFGTIQYLKDLDDMVN